MILGLSHVAFSSDNIDAATARLAGFGYVQRFDEPALENHHAKTSLLTRHQPQHHIRALAADGVMAIELLNHGKLVGPQTSALLPIFRSRTPCPDWKKRSLEHIPISQRGFTNLRDSLGRVPQAFYDPALSMTMLWIPEIDGPPGLYACAVPTKDPNDISNMLSQLRFRLDAAGVWTMLTPLRPLQARLILVESQQAAGWTARPFLDAPGCGCLALMARGTESTPMPEHLQGETVFFNLQVNGKNSRITMVRPENGPIIELVDQST